MASADVTDHVVRETGRGINYEAGPARFISEPAALGLAGFALSTVVLSVINVGLVSESVTPVALGLALAYGGLVQLLAGMWAFIKNDTFAAVALSSYGGFWISFYIIEHVFNGKIPAADQNAALALYLFGWGIFTFYMWIASFRVSVAVNLVFATLVPTYFLLGAGKAAGVDAVFEAGGGMGILCGFIAWYTSAAIVCNKTFARDVLPVGHLRGVEQDLGVGGSSQAM